MTTSTTSSVFSGRCECTDDIFRCLKALYFPAKAINVGLTKVTIDLGFFEPGHLSGEAMVELHFNTPVGVAWLNQIIASVEDAHVFHQTLRPCLASENSMERDWDKR